jgi:hypothetical protein
MSTSRHFPKHARQRFAELLLRQIYELGGQHRYIPVAELEDELGLEPELILQLCGTRLLGEIQVSDRLTADVDDSCALNSPMERLWLRQCYSEPHVRIRPAAVRLTEDELLQRK